MKKKLINRAKKRGRAQYGYRRFGQATDAKSIEELKQVSSVKGFLGFKTK